MRYIVAFAAFLMVSTSALAQDDPVVLVVHGGAGGNKKAMGPAVEKQCRDTMERALKAGRDAIDKGESLDGVEAAIKVLEDSGHFNAGKGAVFNRDGRQELNASIMDGKTRKAGAIAGICRVKNPIAACRVIMEKSGHVFMIGESAERYCKDQGVEMVSPLYFWTDRAWKELQSANAGAKKKAAGLPSPPERGAGGEGDPPHFGTVGAAARDRKGNLAAGTSTGGITYVRPGRVGDSPIIGAGTYAENGVGAVSCTGKGELFIRHTVASDIAARMEYAGDSVNLAASKALNGLPKNPGGAGGIIAIDSKGNVATIFNTAGMFRGTITQSGKIWIAIDPD